MAILIANDGDKIVNTIAERDAIIKKFDGMEVTVKDAIADLMVGGGRAGYQWDTGAQVWKLVWKHNKDDLVFVTENLPISNGLVTLTNSPQSALVWDSFVTDAAGNMLVKLSNPTVTGKSVSLGSAEYNGETLWVSYAYGKIQAAVAATAITKVTSTDNALVRFDGTTGDVKNSLVTVDDGGNVGIGVALSTWTTGKVIEIGNVGNAIWGNSTANMYLTENTYYGGGWKYASANPAATYQLLANSHIWSIAPTGTLGAAVTFTSAMKLSGAGNLLINKTTDDGINKLQVTGNVNINGIPIGKYISGTIETGEEFIINIPETEFLNVYCGTMIVRNISTAGANYRTTGMYLVDTWQGSSSTATLIGTQVVAGAGMSFTVTMSTVGNAYTQLRFKNTATVETYRPNAASYFHISFR